MDASVGPRGSLEMLSQSEIDALLNSDAGGIHPLFRKCALAVLNSGSDNDNAKELFEQYRDFQVRVVRHPWGIRLEITNAPARAFVDGQMINGIKEHLFAVLRDVVYIAHEIEQGGRFDLATGAGLTNAVFHVLRNAQVLNRRIRPNLVVCWGGHSINETEYQYTKRVGYEMGLRGLDVCTGCGPGAMKGPMKGATIGHAKQRISAGRYIGLTEPGIIAAEPPNAIVNQLVIMPDIEKRLEAFVRISHAIVVFPGGVGTAEEILYLLGILLHPANAAMPFPLIFTGPRESAAYFEQIDRFLRLALGDQVGERYRIIVDDPAAVGREVAKGVERVRSFRLDNKDAFFFNWALQIEQDFQVPFRPSHEAMAALNLHRDQPAHRLAADLRRAFSGIVAGNVKEEGMRAIERFGPFEIDGDREVMQALDAMLASFVVQQRMKLPGTRYEPCYRIRVD